MLPPFFKLACQFAPQASIHDRSYGEVSGKRYNINFENFEQHARRPFRGNFGEHESGK